MATNWTKKQLLAIEARDKTLLVSAAAGSGKTATLTERIVRKIMDEQNPTSIDRMLVVTFTVPSANDLKRKISNALSDALAENPLNKHLSKQLILLDGASISTIDSFYLNIVKKNFQRLSLPSSFRLADEGEMVLLRKEIMNEIIDSYYDKKDDEGIFLRFVENFTDAKQSDTLADVLLSLENKLSPRLEGVDYILTLATELKNDAGVDFFQSRQGGIIYSYLSEGVKFYHDAISKCYDIISNDENASEKYLPAFTLDRMYLEELLEVLEKKNYTLAREKILCHSKEDLKKLGKAYQTEEILICKDLRKEYLEFIKEIKKSFFSFTSDEISSIIKQSSEILFFLHRVLSEFKEKSLAEKMKRKIFDFDDIRCFAYRILSNEDGTPSDIALAISEQYDEIYIDEYQDVNAMQDQIFRLISKENNRFMVGDIKQSIYGFRGAASDVFANYKKSFPPFEEAENSTNALIFMSNNFRCDENVVDFTNLVFSFLFEQCGKSIEYTKDDNLIFSKVEKGRTLPSPKVNITIITGDKSAADDDDNVSENNEIEVENDGDAEINPEAIWIANEIQRLLKYEKKADNTKIEPKDIAILMRSRTLAPDITRALRKLNIPCADNSKQELFETPEVLLVLSLLSAIDNPHRDIPLTATLYSPIFGYTMDELIMLRRSADPSKSLFEALRDYESIEDVSKEIVSKNKYFIEKLTKYRDLATYLSIDKLINFIYRDLSIMSFENAKTQNLTRIYEMARRFESTSFKGLNNFISYINELIDNKKVPSLKNDDADSNAVQMITAHKSKGLEFPVCFLCNCSKTFANDDLKPNMLYDPNAGIALKIAKEGGFARLNSPLREAIALSIKDSQCDEEMRILYVALTRARERLYLTACTTSHHDTLLTNAKNNSYFASNFKLRRNRNWLALVLAALHPFENDKSYTLTSLAKDEVEFELGETAGISVQSIQNQTISDAKIEEIQNRLNTTYHAPHLSRLPAKLSVSKLSPTILDDMDKDFSTLEEFDEAKILEIEEYFESKSKSSSAERGTATHLFLQFCDFANAENNGVEAELARLVDRKFIAPEVAKLINIFQIKQFFKSKFYSHLKSATRVYREQRFNILLPATNFTNDSQFKSEIRDEDVLVQGVIDLCFTTPDGQIVLCDYKTDYLTKDEREDEALATKKMQERHAKQLSYYSMAIEKLLGKAPDKILIYSLPFGETLEINV